MQEGQRGQINAGEQRSEINAGRSTREINVGKRKTKNKCDSAAVRLYPDASGDELAKLAWAIAHPARIAIVRFLIGRDTCMCGEIVSSLPLAQSTVSQHLKILKQAQLIQGQVDGPKVCYCINQKMLDRLKTLVGKL